ncbi:MAG: hypothetical protein R2795_22085 [Saprospiraceae bacterium]
MTNKTVSVHGHFKNEPVALLPGTYLQAQIFTDSAERWAVPESAIVREGASTFVFIKRGDGYEKTAVQIAPPVDGWVSILNEEAIIDKELVLKGAYYLNVGE